MNDQCSATTQLGYRCRNWTMIGHPTCRVHHNCDDYLEVVGREQIGPVDVVVALGCQWCPRGARLLYVDPAQVARRVGDEA